MKEKGEAYAKARLIFEKWKPKLEAFTEKYRPKNLVTLLLGAPGVGKSTSIKNIKDQHWPAVDLEDWPHEQRIEVLKLFKHGTAGAADLNPKTIQKGEYLWILLNKTEADYAHDRYSRDEVLTYKKDQRHFTMEDWYNKYANDDCVLVYDLDTNDVKSLVLYYLIILTHNYVSKLLLDKFNLKRLRNVYDLIRQQQNKDGLRVTKYPFGQIIDSSNLCLFNNYELPVFKTPNLANKIVDDLVIKFGEKINYKELDVEITRQMRANKDVRHHWNYNLFTVHNRVQDENTICIPLSPIGLNIDGSVNRCRYAVLTFNCAETYIFLSTFVSNLLQNVKNNEELEQTISILTDWRCTLGFSLSAAYNKLFESKENAFEQSCKTIGCRYFKEYFDILHNNAERIIEVLGDEFRTKLNEKKSMGAGAVINGEPINKKKYWLVFHYLLAHPDVEHNSWVYYTNLPDKLELLAQWYKITYGFELIERYGFENPKTWIDLFLNDICPGNTTAFRVNGNDVPLFVDKVDKSKAIWTVSTHKLTVDDIPILLKQLTAIKEYFFEVQKDENRLLKEDWPLMTITTKPREWVNQVDIEGYYVLTFSPYQFRSIYNDEVKRLNRATSKLNLKRPLFYPCVTLTNKLRQMYPGTWLVNTYFGPIARFYSVPFEKSDIGFIQLSVDSSYLHLLRHHYDNFSTILPAASDISHSETTMSSDSILLDLIGTTVGMRTFFRFACSGLASSKIGLRWHDFAIMSGLTFTTAANIWAGVHKKSLYYCYLAVPSKRITTYENNLKIIFASAYRYLNTKTSIKIPDWVITVRNDYLLDIETEKGVLSVIQSIGTDDQVWTFMSNTLSETDIHSICNNKDVTDFCNRYHNNVELGAATHFGVKLTKNGFEPNAKSALAKITSNEKKRQGDPMSTGITETLRQNTSALVAFDEGLRSINAGNHKPYFLASQWFTALLQQLPQYGDSILQEYNAPYSPSGKRMAEALERTGYSITDEKKMPLTIVRDIILRHIQIIKRLDKNA